MTKNLWQFSNNFVKNLSFVAIFLIALAVPLTVVVSQKQQETRQQAAVNDCLYFSNLSTARLCAARQAGCYITPKNFQNQYGCCCPPVLSTTTTTISTTTTTLKPTIGTPLTWCARCSDTYRFCRVQWQGNQTCSDTWNEKYYLDCSCQQGRSSCLLKGLNTSICNTISTQAAHF